MASNVDSTPSNFAFTSRKRKRKNFSFDLVKQMVYSVDDNAEPETLKAAWQKLKSIFEAGELEYAGTVKKSKLEKASYQYLIGIFLLLTSIL